MDRFHSLRVWSPQCTPLAFGVIGFLGRIQTDSRDMMSVWLEDTKQNLNNFSSSLNHFQRFSSHSKQSATMARYTNPTFHGISGGALLFGGGSTSVINSVLVGVHCMGNSIEGTNSGTLVDRKVWKWIEKIQDENKNPCNNLLIAILRGRSNEVEFFLNQVDHIDWENFALMKSIIQNGNVSMTKLLYKHSILFRNKMIISALASEIPTIYPVSLSKPMLEYFMTLGFNPLAAPVEGFSEFYKISCRWQNDCITRRLIELGASVNHIFNDGNDPLSIVMASSNSDVKVAKLLIEHSANVDYVYCESRKLNAFTWATFKGQSEMIQLLIDYGANVNFTNSSGNGSLHPLISFGKTYRKRRLEIAKMLIEANANVNAITSMGSLLEIAISEKWPEMFHLLLAYGASVPPPSKLQQVFRGQEL